MDSADSLPPLPVFSVFERGKLPELPRNDEPPATGQHPPTSAAPARPEKSLKPVAILQAAGERTRWRVLRELSKGTPVAIRNLADALGVTPDLLSKHLAVLRACGAVTEVSGADARQRLQTIPPEFASRVEGEVRVLDYGACVQRFPGGRRRKHPERRPFLRILGRSRNQTGEKAGGEARPLNAI